MVYHSLSAFFSQPKNVNINNSVTLVVFKIKFTETTFGLVSVWRISPGEFSSASSAKLFISDSVPE